ncbi:MaoC family dehydratase [Halovivax gelatinilyticus]|uniref:MaoC family dehydratase n=1 Tax=Halovivax gelatinilyticus TaxID=2961597 RepID=UPI0020CA61E8|nr:MaoC family dehydratase [Halovivax gelatinilyticus]
MPEYYEDISIGDTREFGERTVTKDEIVEFAEKYDPQPIHVDESAAEATMFGGLIASGWHTAAICMRLFVDHMADETWVGARGVDELRWIRPVRPGDTLSLSVEVVEKRPDESNPEVGRVHTRLTATNQRDEAVISWIGLGMVRRRESA